MRIRLIGTPAECRLVPNILTGQATTRMTVHSVSGEYVDGPGRVRVYVDADLPDRPTWDDVTGCCTDCGSSPQSLHGEECRWYEGGAR